VDERRGKKSWVSHESPVDGKGCGNRFFMKNVEWGVVWQEFVRRVSVRSFKGEDQGFQEDGKIGG